jgi:hypothetical protein
MATLLLPNVRFYEQAIKKLYPTSELDIDYKILFDIDGNLNIIFWNNYTLGDKPENILDLINKTELEIKIDYIIPLVIAQVNNQCNTKITQFTSSVLGTPHVYKYAIEDQFNLQNMVISNIDGKLQVKEVGVDSVFKLKDHTASQISQLYNESTINKLSILEHYRKVKDLINNATSLAELESIEI